MYKNILPIALSVTLLSCTAPKEIQNPQDKVNRNQSIITTTMPQISVNALSEADYASVVSGSINFGLDLIKQITNSDTYNHENVFISPISMSSAFGLAYAGSGGVTETEIAQVMNFDLPHDRIHITLGTLQKKIEDDREGQLFDMANTIFVDKRLEVERDYSDLIKTNYGASEQKTDIYNRPENAVDVVNGWVDEQTNGMIPETITIKDMNINAQGKSEVASIMVNTAYLKADWLSKFAKSNTRNEIFNTPHGSVNLPIMNQKGLIPFYKGRGFKAIDLLYQDRTMAMTVLLPNHKTGAVKLAQNLSAKKLNTIFGTLENYDNSINRVDLKLPKADLSDDYKLKDNLESMGMKTAFKDEANFDGRFNPEKMKRVNSLYDGVKIDEVIHKTALKVDEDGTEAAAVTAILDTIIVTSAGPKPKYIDFHVDRPYVIVIRHIETGAVLFIGAVNNPVP